MGLVTVALLTLAPLPLRGARLACLIHAANVHSEPGSNPSIKVESLQSKLCINSLLTQWVEDYILVLANSAPITADPPSAVDDDRSRSPPASLKDSYDLTIEPRNDRIIKDITQISPTTRPAGANPFGLHSGRYLQLSLNRFRLSSLLSRRSVLSGDKGDNNSSRSGFNPLLRNSSNIAADSTRAGQEPGIDRVVTG